MCREGAWAELTVQVTHMGVARRRMHGHETVSDRTLDLFPAFFFVENAPAEHSCASDRQAEILLFFVRSRLPFGGTADRMPFCAMLLGRGGEKPESIVNSRFERGKK